MEMKIRHRKEGFASGLKKEIHPVLRRILLGRGVQTDDDILLPLSRLESPKQLANIASAVEILTVALAKQEKILIIGDFDADGATSTALLILCLKKFGFTKLEYLVPNRFEYGYGLTPEIVEVAKACVADLIITVDNGIASIDGVAKAKELGFKVLITDHHLPASNLPEADCILNPNLADCSFPSKALAGVGVVYYLLLELRAKLREDKWFTAEIPEPNMLQFLDLVALGTVADVVPLDSNNRCLVKHGLEIIKSGRARPGINALLDIAGKNKNKLQATDLGFIVGPRINAAGRLDDMSRGIECLLADSPAKAYQLAQQLDDLNKERKNIESSMQKQALSVLEGIDEIEFGGNGGNGGNEEKGICLFNSEWHQGVIGILASRLKEKFNCPVIVFAESNEVKSANKSLKKNSEEELANSSQNLEVKGSARSIPGLNIRDLLDAIATKNKGLLSKFGGHAMAAGLSLPLSKLPLFKAAFLEELELCLDSQMLEKVIYSDGVLEADCLTLDFAELLETAGPWGQHFPEPIFNGSFKVLDQRILGDKHLKMLLQLPDSDTLIDGIAFNVEESILKQHLSDINLAYRLQVNDFRGQRSAQLLVEHFIEV